MDTKELLEYINLRYFIRIQEKETIVGERMLVGRPIVGTIFVNDTAQKISLRYFDTDLNCYTEDFYELPEYKNFVDTEQGKVCFKFTKPHNGFNTIIKFYEA